MKFRLPASALLLALVCAVAPLSAQPVTFVGNSYVPDGHSFLLAQDNTWGDVVFLVSTDQAWKRSGTGPGSTWTPFGGRFQADIKLGQGSEVSWMITVHHPDHPEGSPILLFTGARNAIYFFSGQNAELNATTAAQGPQPGNGLAAATGRPIIMLSADVLWTIDASFANGTPGAGSQLVNSVGSAPGQLSGASRINYGPDGLLYVLDLGNHRVQGFDVDDHGSLQRSFDLVPVSTTGEGISEGLLDGTMAISPFGHLYFGDGLGGGTTYDLAGNYLGAFHPGAADPAHTVGNGGFNFLMVDDAGHLSVFDLETGLREYTDSLNSGPLANYARTINLGAGTLTVGAGDHSTSFAGVMTGTGGLIKTGTGVHILAGANTYTGTTTVSAGTLVVNGSLANTSSVEVASGATLGGSGTIGGLATFDSGAHLAPGNSPGTLTFTSGLALDSGTILDFQLGTSSDLVRVSGGTLTGSAGAGGITLNLSNSGGFAANTYVLFDFTGANTSSFDISDFTLGTAIAGYDYSFNLTGTSLELIATASAVPEPSTYAAITGLAGLGVALIRRRRLLLS